MPRGGPRAGAGRRTGSINKTTAWSRRSPEAAEYRKLYKTARWQRTRAKQLADEPLCRMCAAAGDVTEATICDHVDPKDKLDPELFFTGEKQSLCKDHHDSSKQREEKRGHEIGCDESGFPLDPNHPWNLTRGVSKNSGSDA